MPTPSPLTEAKAEIGRLRTRLGRVLQLLSIVTEEACEATDQLAALQGRLERQEQTEQLAQATLDLDRSARRPKAKR